MNDSTLVSYLRLVEMPTDDELATQRRRRAWWIASARRADPRAPTLIDVALAVGYKENSKSTISDWENNVGGGPSIAKLHRLASFYGLPVSLFMEPSPTEQEHLDQVRALAIDAVALEHGDSELAAGVGPDDEDGPDVPRHRQSA